MAIQHIYTIPTDKKLRIAVSGLSGCGNTTVSALLAKMLGITCINYTFRTLAEELNMPLSDLIEQSKTDFHFDRLIDTRQIEYAMKQSCVLGSRLAIWLLKAADMTIYLYASLDERAKRIQKREGGDIESIKAFTSMRDSSDTVRYKTLYGINNTDYSKADMVIDTELHTPQMIADEVLAELVSRSLIIRT